MSVESPTHLVAKYSFLAILDSARLTSPTRAIQISYSLLEANPSLIVLRWRPRLLPTKRAKITAPSSVTAGNFKLKASSHYGIYLHKVSRLDRNCVDACPLTGYYISSEMVCLSCHASCNNCTGPELHQCLSCAPTYNQVLDKNLCVEHCPDGYHFGTVFLLLMVWFIV